MPMAGEGSRFKKEGWTTPKPLIELHGTPLFIRAINSVKVDGCQMKYSLIVRQEHIDEYAIDKQIKAILPDANVFSVLKTTRGAVETCLVAESAIADDDAVVVMDCDLEFSSQEYINIIREELSKENACGGALVSFKSDLPKYSYAEVDENGRVIRTSEKKVISNNALCGAYFFSSGKEFKQVAHQLIGEAEFKEPEFYLSLLYNYLLKAGDEVRIAHLDKYYSYGTPEELKQYL
jgi:NDP-sugar pyrophosphorylase family protein